VRTVFCAVIKRRRIGEYADAGLSSFVISIDAATAQAHEDNRGLPGVCDKIREANRENHPPRRPVTAR
jgi:MoaA/NifB/PqqE/SkfB family radical SAM enzyme